MNRTADLEHSRFLRDWSTFIDRWARKTLSGQGSSADLDDLRQVARVAAWLGYQEWSALPDDARDQPMLAAIVGRKIKDAILDEWCRLRQRPRDEHQRGGGWAAELFRDYLSALAKKSRSELVRGRPDVIARYLTAYHLFMAGTAHSPTGLVTAETTLLRDEIRQRLVYAIERLTDAERALIEGVYFHRRTLADVGAELGVHGRSAQSRLHHKALDSMRTYMDEFASGLGARNTGGTLDDEPIGGGSIV